MYVLTRTAVGMKIRYKTELIVSRLVVTMRTIFCTMKKKLCILFI